MEYERSKGSTATTTVHVTALPVQLRYRRRLRHSVAVIVVQPPPPSLLNSASSMHPRHPTAADRARSLKRSSPPTHPSADEIPKLQRTQPSTSTVNDENVNTLNTHIDTHTASLVAPDSPSPSASCECGHCPPAPTPVPDSVAMQLQRCCWQIEPASCLLGDSSPLCERSDIASVIRDGVSAADFEYCCKRIKGSRPTSFAACNQAQKRLILYGVLHSMLYGQGGRGRRDPMPECIKHMVRSQYADSSTVSF